MSVRGSGGATTPPAVTQAQAAQQAEAQTQTQNQATNTEQKAKNAAGKQAHSSPKAEYQRPHRTHTGQEFRVATQRKHEEALRQEAAQHMVGEEHVQIQQAEMELREDQRLTGINWDDKRKKKGRQQDQDQDAPDQESQEEAAAKSLGIEGSSGKYFQDMPEDRMGDLSLLSPNDMKRLLGPSVRFAQHAMILAEARMKEGMPRQEAVEFMASLYLGVSDRAYANKALRDFGAATGVIDLYPLELMKHLLEHVPSFLNKVSTARFLAATPVEGYKIKAGVPLKLTYDPTLRIRGFAVKGGLKPGYLLEPIDPPGTYHLSFATPGSYGVMLSALSKDGQLRIEEFTVDVSPGDGVDLESAPTMQKTRANVSDPDAANPSAPAGSAAIPAASTDPALQAAQDAKAAKKKDLKFTLPRKI